MKRLFTILCLLLLLTGCAGNPDYTVRSSVPEKAAHLSAPVAVRPAPPTLLDGLTPLEGYEDIYEIPTSALEGLSYPSTVEFCGQLLFYAHNYNAEAEQSEIELVAMNCYTGDVTARASFAMDGYVFPQIRGELLYLCDHSLGYVKCLDKQLNVVSDRTVNLYGSQWLVNGDGTALYQMEFGGDCMVVDLATGESKPYETDIDIHGLFSTERNDHHAFMSYVGGQELLNSVGSLDFATGELEEAPFDDTINSVTRWGDRWLGYRFDGGYSYYDGQQTWVIQPPEGYDVLQVKETGHLLVRNYSSRHLMLYDTDGTFLDECSLALEAEAFPNDDLTWSEFYQGYFVTVTNHDGACRLFFWQPGGSSGNDLELIAEAEYDGPVEGDAVDPALYQRAAELSEKYGVEIRIADQCETEYSDYVTVQVTDEDAITYALDVLDEAFSAYPEGFFPQLSYGSIRKVQIHLSGALTGQESHEMTSAGAFTQPAGDIYLMVMDIYQYQLEANFHHELSHIIDHNLDWHSQYEDTLFSEEDWRALSPEDVEYSYTYGYWPPSYEEGAQGYFVDDYSRTYPTEDRARIFEYAMCDWHYVFDDSPALMDKLDYYARCIRDCFNTDGWPDTVPWEEPLLEE